MTGRELPDRFEEFARPKTVISCRRCGDEVRRRFVDEGICVGCRHRPVTDGGVDVDGTERYDVEDAIEDGYVRVEPAGDPEEEEPNLRLTDHGEAAGRDVLRRNNAGVAYVVELHVTACMERGGDDEDLVYALAEITKHLAEDTGVNAYRILRENPDLAPWLKDDAISEEMVQAVEDDWIEIEQSSTDAKHTRRDA